MVHCNTGFYTILLYNKNVVLKDFLHGRGLKAELCQPYILIFLFYASLFCIYSSIFNMEYIITNKSLKG